jgi:hypothetical protein
MRSQDVFAAAKQVRNRFLLCRVTSVSSHRLHVAPKHFSESINRALHEIARSTEHTEKNAANVVASVGNG